MSEDTPDLVRKARELAAQKLAAGGVSPAAPVDDEPAGPPPAEPAAEAPAPPPKPPRSWGASVIQLGLGVVLLALVTPALWGALHGFITIPRSPHALAQVNTWLKVLGLLIAAGLAYRGWSMWQKTGQKSDGAAKARRITAVIIMATAAAVAVLPLATGINRLPWYQLMAWAAALWLLARAGWAVYCGLVARSEALQVGPTLGRVAAAVLLLAIPFGAHWAGPGGVPLDGSSSPAAQHNPATTELSAGASCAGAAAGNRQACANNQGLDANAAWLNLQDALQDCRGHRDAGRTDEFAECRSEIFDPGGELERNLDVIQRTVDLIKSLGQPVPEQYQALLDMPRDNPELWLEQA